ncbi:MAG: MmgE/PrpD family protein [Deltaproteobacteria bacterium]|nr:MmgE/PrpD family protein [Deltaproteobacteria bacterium]
MNETTIEWLARWAAELRFEDIPERVKAKARLQQASVIAASFAGLHDDGARRVIDATRKHGGNGGARVIAGGFRTSRPAAVLANASVSCTFDYDEILLLGHPGHSSVTVPLVLGEELGASRDDILAAQVAANEIQGRLGLATFLGPQNGQMLPYLHCAGAAIAAGRLLRLNAKETAHALAVALAQPPAALWPAFLGSMDGKILTAAHGASAGVFAAELAAEGFTGALDLLDHERGFFHRFTFVPFHGALTGLGRAWLTDTLQVKLHAACWYYQGLLDALHDAVGRVSRERGRALRPSDIRRVTCRVTALAKAVDASEGGGSRGRLLANEVNFSIPAAVAVMLLRGQLLPADLTAHRLNEIERDVRELAARVEVVHDRAMTGNMLRSVDEAIDVVSLAAPVSGRELAAAGRAARREFPRASVLDARDLMAILPALPRLVRRHRAAREASYDLGDRPVEQCVLSIPGAFEIELADGRRLEGEGVVPEGALSLAGAAQKVAAKLCSSSHEILSESDIERLWNAITNAKTGVSIDELAAALDAVPAGQRRFDRR